MRYISLTVEVWTAAGWQDCCSRDRGRTQFYADDKVDEEGEVRSPCPSSRPVLPGDDPLVRPPGGRGQGQDQGVRLPPLDRK